MLGSATGGILLCMVLCLAILLVRNRPLGFLPSTGDDEPVSICDQPQMVVVSTGGQAPPDAPFRTGEPQVFIETPLLTPPAVETPTIRVNPSQLPSPSQMGTESPVVETPETRTPPTSPAAIAGTGATSVPPDTNAPSRRITSVAFLDLPFPYDGGNANFGGTLEQFKQASQRRRSGGRINSFFDHYFPLYPASFEGGQEPGESPIGGNILIFDGLLSGSDDYSGHPAYDYSTFEFRQPTTPVFAAAEGTVIAASDKGAGGAYYVKIRHQVPGVGDFLTIYWHLHPDEYFEAMRGRVEQVVAAGERIGTMGNTGFSTGHHLHFEVRFDRNRDGSFPQGEVVDPYGFIPSAGYATDPWFERTQLTSQYLWIHPLGVTAEIPETGGGALSLPGGSVGTGGAAAPITLCARPGSLPPGGRITWSWAPDPAPSPSSAGTGDGCVLSVTDAQGRLVDRFEQPITITIPFDLASLVNLDPQTLAIYWQDSLQNAWQALDTQVDFDERIARSLAERAGKCALMGRPTVDLVAPKTQIEVTGLTAPGGAWYDVVTVTLSSADESGIESIVYSLDNGSTWRPYAGPFKLEPKGIPTPLPPLDEEYFGGSGPGSYVVLAYAADEAGNLEEPPAHRVIVIDPSKNPGTAILTPTTSGTPSPTTTRTSTPTPTSTATKTRTLTPTVTRTVTLTPTRTKTPTITASPPTVTTIAPVVTTEIPVPPAPPNLLQPTGDEELPCDQTVVLSWEAVDYLGGIEQYDWQIEYEDDGEYTLADQGSTSELQASLTGLACGAHFRWSVRAVGSMGNPGDYSSPAEFWYTTPATEPPTDDQSPPAPALFSPTGDQDLACEETILLSWGAVEDPSGIAYYEWEIYPEDDTELAGSGTTDTLSAEAFLSCGGSYVWIVRAVDGAENVGEYSAPGTFTILFPDSDGPPPPTLLSPAGEQELPCQETIPLSWEASGDPSGIDHYDWEVYRDLIDDFVLDASGSTDGLNADAFLSCGGSYAWRVRAVDGAGNVGEYSSSESFSILLPPGLADLTPAADCQLEEETGNLIVEVTNLGEADAPESTTLVEFAGGESFELETPSIPPDGSTDLAPLPIPPDCYNPDCSFTITVDSENIVAETDEDDNNTGSGTCGGIG